MKTMPELTGDGLEALRTVLAASTEGADRSPDGALPDEALRLLAFLKPLMHRIVEDAAASVGSSPVKAAAFAMLAEGLQRVAGYGQILAVGRIDDAEAHTLKDEPLVELRRLLADPADFIAGGSPLPAVQCSKPGTKHLFKDPAQFLKNQLHLTFFQSQQRLAAGNHLVPHSGFNNKTVAPRFPELARLLRQGDADPQLVAGAAQRLEKLRPALEHQSDPTAVADAESKLARALHTRDAAGINLLLKHLAVELDSTVIDDEESVHRANFGMRFRGKRSQGYFWEITTGVEGHELLSTLADQLNNPRNSANANANANGPVQVDSGSARPSREGSATQPELPGLATIIGQPTAPGQEAPRPAPPPAGLQTPDPQTIPDWAVDPGTPQELRPVAGFTDLGQAAQPEPLPEMLPGETPEQARARFKERRLLQAVLDSIRYAASTEPGAPGPDPGMPMKPNLGIMITLSWDSLVGRLNDPGISTHGHPISAAAVRRMACKANIIPAVLGTLSQPLDLGRTQRFFNRAQRRAIAARDRGCINPGCSMPAHRCEANHIKPWYLGGKTNVDNACLLCASCHAAFHAGHFTIVVAGGVPYALASKANDPQQVPRRNWIWHPEEDVA